jgi:hypothetical protein
MHTARSGHGQTLLGNGDVLIVGGVVNGTTHPISGWGTIQIPVFTDLCQRFVPATNSFAPVPQIPLARGWHGQSRLANGNVLVTGGAASVGAYTEAAATSDCQIYDVATNTWTPAALLPFAVAFHTQVTEPRTGAAWLAGGYIGNFASLQAIPQVLMHGGAAVTTLADLGTNPGAGTSAWPTAAHSATLLHDGTLLVVGGYDGVTQPLAPPAALLIAP